MQGKPFILSCIGGLETPNIIALWNLTREPDKKIKKFESRARGIDALATLILGWNVTKDEPNGYENFFGDFAVIANKLGINLPEPPATPAEPEVKTKKNLDKVIVSAQLNLRCPECGYFAKTTVEMLERGRLVCPMDKKHGILKTADERGEKRGR